MTTLAAFTLGVVLAGCTDQGTGARAEGTSETMNEVRGTDTKVLWVGDSIAGAEAPAVKAALEAGGVRFEDASSDGGGTVVAGSEKITKMIADDTWKRLARSIESLRPTVVAYQITTYDWGSREQQRMAYEKLVRTTKDAGARTVFVPAPPVRVDDFYKQHTPQMRTAPRIAREVAEDSGGAAVFLDSSRLWGTDAAAQKAQRAADGIHNCQQGAAAFAAWFSTELGEEENFTPAAVNIWAKGSWTGDKRYANLKCDS
ncbi:SGNH/GDSL hydrolase family protein [Streptomyces sp. NPDC006285]|uniref:SGNH/GDSL hydrolase family protein n=1 Tax=Streptomyces sp. NPDC006285 TaxID=3364742 RepID=UPI003687D9AB